MDFENLSIEELRTLIEENRNSAREVAALDGPTLAQVEEAEQALSVADDAQTEIDRRETEAEALATRSAALRDAVAEPEVEAAVEEPEEPEVEAAVEAEEASEETPEEETPVETAAATEPVQPKPTASLAGRRPKVPAKSPVTITASADVPGYGNGQQIEMGDVAEGMIARLRGFSPPSAPGPRQHYGVATFRNDFPEELIANNDSRDYEVLMHAADEHRLDGGSLTAAGGWCAPSETLYDLCVTETLDGILSIPEILVRRGGLNLTKGPDFSEIYNSVGFCQTEAEAIAGTAKDCFEIPCPPFTEVRLDACGLCIKSPILTNSAYPELVQRWISGSMVAHAHKMNNKVITEMATAAGAPLTVNDFTGAAASTLANLELIADRVRAQYKLSRDATLEVVVPHWVRGAIRSDLALRNGGTEQAITDAMIRSEFAARHLNVQFVYDWQEMAANTVTQGYPATFNALMYPAGTFVKGVQDVLTLNAVYDSVDLETNVYTALFFEQGILVANPCNDATLVTLPVCIAGRTGASDVTECGLGADA